MDQESGQSEGKIFFVGNQFYKGEIMNQLPHGEGLLKLFDGSIFKGKFENGNFIEGIYKHQSGIEVEGLFNKDKLVKGKIRFIDGDYLSGEFGFRRNKWMIKKANLHQEDGTLIQRISPNQDQIQSRLKTLYVNDFQQGFFVQYDYYYLQNDCWEPFFFSGDLSYNYSIKNDSQTIKNYVNLNSIVHLKQEFYDEKILTKEKYLIFLETQIELQKSIDQGIWIMKFDFYTNLHFQGDFSFEKNKFHFKGNIFIAYSKIGLVEIQTYLFRKISINFDQQQFQNIKSFLEELSKKYQNIKKIDQNITKNMELYNKQAMNDIVNDLKENQDCKIF